MLNAAQLQHQLQRAQAFAQAGRTGEAWSAIAPLRPAIDGHGGALRLYAFIAQNAGKADDAIAALRRICALERDPPEILGALADTLGTAGRHAEAYEIWSRLVAKQPGAIDAHLNRAVEADKAGRFADAIAAADLGLARAPADARLLSARALALSHADRMAEAIGAYDTAVAADPTRAQTRYHQAVCLRAACRFDEACAAYAEAERLGAGGADFHAAFAAAELEAGKVDAAADRYRRLLAAVPDHDEARRALTRLELEFRDPARAFDHYAERARASGQPGPWQDYLAALLANKRFGDAANVGREALARLGSDLPILRTTLFAEGIVGDAGAALDAMERLPAALVRGSDGLIARAQLALRAGRVAECARLSEAYNALAGAEQSGWSLLTLAWRLLDDPREQWLCDYDRLVMPVEVAPVDGTLDAADYAAVVAAALDPLHTSLAAPGDQSLRHGTQTSGALFARLDPAIQRFRDAVLAAAEQAVDALPDDPTHPFLRRKSGALRFNGSWSVRLQGGGGHHVPHFHGEGWMSSAYYARLPRSDEAAHAAHAGWIEFGRAPAMYDLDLPPRRVVEPTEGRLVLFPSYLWHGTVPFEAGRGTRLTAAFDYLPA